MRARRRPFSRAQLALVIRCERFGGNLGGKKPVRLTPRNRVATAANVPMGVLRVVEAEVNHGHQDLRDCQPRATKRNERTGVRPGPCQRRIAPEHHCSDLGLRRGGGRKRSRCHYARSHRRSPQSLGHGARGPNGNPSGQLHGTRHPVDARQRCRQHDARIQDFARPRPSRWIRARSGPRAMCSIAAAASARRKAASPMRKAGCSRMARRLV